ncbi:type II secretion system protein GspM [Denitratisoma oestradiolicum]|uniref:Putative Type II secretion system protein M (GspM) n=1 Tax=Denitratisoma oestradiolicum TaxID=311182 RepID=A0A6S6YE19_9PROT|nr:type II secretion system protein GspM [Denitratisoma oestradiolicum]TWO79201.1 hypothetical protein CBW56_16080 [Denitratisoma oestradiolicum]CAB1370846.1 putative Type II secretion system protein M (GspM) [Denitratisoma oestradiolicum]
MKSTMNTWINQWRQHSPREQRQLAAGALILIAALIYVGFWSPGHRAIARLERELPTLRAEVAALRSLPKILNTLGPNLALQAGSAQSAQAQAKALGLKLDLHAQDNSTLTVSGQGLRYYTLLQWLDGLHRKGGLAVRQARLQAGATAGQVDVQLELAPTEGST